MSGGRLNRRNVVFGTLGLAVAAGYGASKLAGTIVRRGMPMDRLLPGKVMLGPIAFGLTGPAGARSELASHWGAPFVLHVWATWCPPCRHELPGLARFMKAWGSDCPVVPVAVSSGSPEDVCAFLKRNDVGGLPVWTVDGTDLKTWYGSAELAIPVTFLIDGAGRVRAVAAGSLDWGDPGAEAALRRVLAATTV